MIEQFCERDDRLGFVDVDHALLGWDEKPRPELYVEDGLHLSAAGYQILTALVRPLPDAGAWTAVASASDVSARTAWSPGCLKLASLLALPSTIRFIR